MLSTSTRKRIKEHKWSEHSNQSQFFKRIKEQCKQALSDLALLANSLDQDQLEEIFTANNLQPLIKSLMDPKTKTDIQFTDEQHDRIIQLGILLITSSIRPMSFHIVDNHWKKLYFDKQVEPLDMTLFGMKQDIVLKKTKSKKD